MTENSSFWVKSCVFIMAQLQELFQRAITEMKQIDPNDRKVQITAATSTVLAILLFIKLSRKRNFWEEMPRYKKPTRDELPNPNEASKIERCSKPSDELEIVFSKSGPGSVKPITIQELWLEAVKNGGDEPFIALEKLQDDNSWKFTFTSWRQADDEFNRIAKSLIGIGVKPFDIINIIGSCSPMFHYLFFGVIMAGAVPGGCYTTNLSGSLKHICNLCKTKVCPYFLLFSVFPLKII